MIVLMKEYSEEFTIPYYDCEKTGYVKPVALVDYLVETSTLHSDSIELGMEDLDQQDFAWILSRWKIKIYSYPKARQEITIKTWASKFQLFYGNREFEIYDKDGNLLLKASTLWVFMDVSRGRPVRIPKEIAESFNYIDKKNFDEFYKFSNDFTEGASMDFRVRKTDIDYNNHVNNAKYVNWILEPIPLEVEEEYSLEELDIYYKKEIKFNHIVESKLSKKEEEDGKIVYFHNIYNKDTGQLTTQARTVWKKD